MRARFSLIGTSLAVAAIAACSSSASKSASPLSTAKRATTVTAPPKCVPPNTGGPVVATHVPGVASDWTMTAFDGAKIRLHWFSAPNATRARPAPTILMGPGWGLPGDTKSATAGLFGPISVDGLNDAGYNVLTWDPRGFGVSTGTVEIDSKDFEGRDVERMIDWVATRPQAELDGPRDPRVGMAGGSYGGGIQLVAAAIDCRIDAITPVVAWNSLTTSLAESDVPKNGWSSLLITATQGHSVDPHIPHAYQSAVTASMIDPADRAWFASRGPGDLLRRITAPTLIAPGTVDTLFPLDEGIANYRILRDDGVPTAMIWFCGGHGICLTNPGDQSLVPDAIIAWLNRYVKRDAATNTGPRFRFIDQNGHYYAAGDYPLPSAAPVTARGAGTLQLTANGGSGPAHPPAGGTDAVGGLATGVTPAKAANAVNVAITTPSSAVLAGNPQLDLSYSGTVPPGTKPTWVFAQLVDDATGLVVGNQITPVPVTLDGKPHRTSIALEGIAFTARAGGHLTLQLVPTTVAYAQPRLGGGVHFDTIAISVPVARGIAPK